MVSGESNLSQNLSHRGCIMGGGIALEPGVVIEGALAFEKAEDVENEGKESS